MHHFVRLLKYLSYETQLEQTETMLNVHMCIQIEQTVIEKHLFAMEQREKMKEANAEMNGITDVETPVYTNSNTENTHNDSVVDNEAKLRISGTTIDTLCNGSQTPRRSHRLRSRETQ